MESRPSTRVRVGIWTLPVGALIGVVALVLRGPVSPLPEIDPAAWVTAVTGPLYAPAQYAYIIAYVLPYLGFWALYAYLRESSPEERLAFWGFLGAIVGTSLALPTLGVFAYVNPVLGELVGKEDGRLLQILAHVVTGPPVAINLLGGTLYLAGTLLLGIAIWRCGALPKWTGLLVALHGLFLVFGFAILGVLLLAWGFLVVAGGWISVVIWKEKATRSRAT